MGPVGDFLDFGVKPFIFPWFWGPRVLIFVRCKKTSPLIPPMNSRWMRPCKQFWNDPGIRIGEGGSGGGGCMGITCRGGWQGNWSRFASNKFDLYMQARCSRNESCIAVLLESLARSGLTSWCSKFDGSSEISLSKGYDMIKVPFNFSLCCV